jgi:hypothetical protein
MLLAGGVWVVLHDSGRSSAVECALLRFGLSIRPVLAQSGPVANAAAWAVHAALRALGLVQAAGPSALPASGSRWRAPGSAGASRAGLP